MIEVFSMAFTYTALLLAGVVGVCAACAVVGVAVLIILALLAASFDRLTDRLAAKWERKGTQPRTHIGRVIYAGRRDHV